MKKRENDLFPGQKTGVIRIIIKPSNQKETV